MPVPEVGHHHQHAGGEDGEEAEDRHAQVGEEVVLISSAKVERNVRH